LKLSASSKGALGGKNGEQDRGNRSTGPTADPPYRKGSGKEVIVRIRKRMREEATDGATKRG